MSLHRRQNTGNQIDYYKKAYKKYKQKYKQLQASHSSTLRMRGAADADDMLEGKTQEELLDYLVEATWDILVDSPRFLEGYGFNKQRVRKVVDIRELAKDYLIESDGEEIMDMDDVAGQPRIMFNASAWGGWCLGLTVYVGGQLGGGG